jgi:hypothetical protein
MPSVTGTVQKIYENPVKTKFGMKNSYKIMVDGVGYGAGFKKPDVNVGDLVSIDHKGDTYNTILNILRGGATPAPEAGAPGPTTTLHTRATGKEFPIPALHPDRSIVRQNSLSHASRIVAAGTIPWDFSTPLKVADIVIELARRFEAYSCGDLDRVAAEAEVAGE